jgi:hypothetical protein
MPNAECARITPVPVLASGHLLTWPKASQAAFDAYLLAACWKFECVTERVAHLLASTDEIDPPPSRAQEAALARALNEQRVLADDITSLPAKMTQGIKAKAKCLRVMAAHADGAEDDCRDALLNSLLDDLIGTA